MRISWFHKFVYTFVVFLSVMINSRKNLPKQENIQNNKKYRNSWTLLKEIHKKIFIIFKHSYILKYWYYDILSIRKRISLIFTYFLDFLKFICVENLKFLKDKKFENLEIFKNKNLKILKKYVIWNIKILKIWKSQKSQNFWKKIWKSEESPKFWKQISKYQKIRRNKIWKSISPSKSKFQLFLPLTKKIVTLISNMHFCDFPIHPSR